MITVGVAWRPDGSDERQRAYDWCVKRWAALHPDWPIVVGTCPAGPWNIAAALNDAVRQVPDGVVLLVGADTAMDPDVAITAVSEAATGRWVQPAGTLRRLSQAATGALLAGSPDCPLTGPLAGERQRCGLGWGPIVAPVSLLRQIGGWDERFRGWGAEDEAWVCAASTLAGPPVQLDRDCFLLWHEPPIVDKDHYNANLALLARYRAADGDPAAMRALIGEREHEDGAGHE